MVIWVATISHKHGTDAYVAHNEEGIYKQLANFCRIWWNDTGIETGPPESDEACVILYFQMVENESYEIMTATLENE